MPKAPSPSRAISSEGLPCPVPERLPGGSRLHRTKPSLPGAAGHRRGAGSTRTLPTAPSPLGGQRGQVWREIRDRSAPSMDVAPWGWSLSLCHWGGGSASSSPRTCMCPVLALGLRVPGAALKPGVHPWEPPPRCPSPARAPPARDEAPQVMMRGCCVEWVKAQVGSRTLQREHAKDAPAPLSPGSPWASPCPPALPAPLVGAFPGAGNIWAHSHNRVSPTAAAAGPEPLSSAAVCFAASLAPIEAFQLQLLQGV